MVTNKQQVINTLKQNSRQLKEFGVEKMGIFGSFVSGMQNNNSDVDLLSPESLSPYIGPRIEKEVEYVQIA